MMAVSNRQRILEAFKARMEAIRSADGFQTDVGLKVFMGEIVSLGEDDPDQFAAVVPLDDEVKRTGENVSIVLPVQMQACALASLDDPWVRVEAIVADIKRAVELEDRTLGGLVKARFERGPTRPLERPEGSLIVGAAITYLVPYAEGWGTP